MSRTRQAYRPGDNPVPGYRLSESLGRGNFGEVWLASAPGGMEVALKVIDLSGREGAKEFEALQRVKHIHHPNLVPVFASWLLTDDGQVFDDLTGAAATQLLQKRPTGRPAVNRDSSTAFFPRLVELIIAMGLGSRSLAARLEECLNEGKAGIPRDELLDYMEGAARGIDYLNQSIHDLGEGPVPIIHGDIKPHNILIVGNAVQVCDFGLARAIEKLRKTSTGMGTFAYAAPELLDGKASRASDQYCLAMTYIELCTGNLPFSETNPLKVVELHRQGKLDLSEMRVREREVIRRATAVDPDLRWPSCAAMVRALHHACDADEVSPTDTSVEDRVVELDKPPPLSATPPIGATLVMPQMKAAGTGRPPIVRPISETAAVVSELTARPQPQPKLRRWLAIGTAILLLLIAAGVVASLVIPGTRDPKRRIDQLVAQDKIASAFDTAKTVGETLYDNEADRKQLIGHVMARWKDRIEELAREREYDKALTDVKEAPSWAVTEKQREEKLTTVLEGWKKRLDGLAKEFRFREAFAEWQSASALFPGRADAVLDDIERGCRNRIEELTGQGGFAQAIKVWEEAPDSVKTKDAAFWEEQRQYVRAAWSLRVRDLSNENNHKFRDAIATLQEGLPAWLDDQEGKDLVAKVLNHWSMDVEALAAKPDLAKAAGFFQEISSPWLSEDVHTQVEDVRKKAGKACRQRIEERVGQDDFTEACKVVKGIPDAFLDSPGERETQLGNLKTTWEKKVNGLADRDEFSPAVYVMWNKADPSWTVDKNRLLTDLQNRLQSRFNRLVDEKKFSEALGLYDKAAKAFLPPEWEKRRRDLADTWFVVIGKETDSQKIADACETLLKYYPECAAETKLIQVRPLVRKHEYESARKELEELPEADSMPEKLLPLRYALELIAIAKGDQPVSQEQLDKFKQLDKQISPSEPWSLDKEERSAIAKIPVVPPRGIQPPPRPDDPFKEIEQLVANRQFPVARQKLESIAASPTKELWIVVIDLEDPQSAANVDKAMNTAEQLLQPGKLARSQAVRLYQALGEVSSKQYVEKAAKSISDAYMKSAAKKDAAAALGKLWKRIIESSVKDEKENLQQAILSLQQTSERFEKDRVHLVQQDEDIHGGFVDAWRQEGVLVGNRPDELKGQSELDDLVKALPKNQVLYGRYLRARCMKAVASRDRYVPDWKAISDDLAKVFQGPEAGIDDVPKWRKEAVAPLAVEAANTIRQPSSRTREPLGNPFPAADEAELCYRLLQGVSALNPNLLDIKAQATLALAALYRQQPDRELASTLTTTLASRPNDALEEDAPPVLYAYLKIHAKEPKDRQSLVDACTRLCNLLKDKLIGNDHAKEFYEKVLEPVQQLADGMAADAKDKAPLVDFYDGVYQLVSDRKFLAGPVKDRNKWWETLLTNAIKAEEGLPGQPAKDASPSAKRYIERARVRLELQERDPNLASLTPVIEDAEQARKLAPAMYIGHGLACQAYLLRARVQPTRQQMIADLTRAIDSGQEADKHRSEGGSQRANCLVSLSSALVERANYDKENRATDLQQARDRAKEAAELDQGQPDFPYLAQGNAFEDIAWLVEDDKSEDNYQLAIKTFREAATKEVFSPQANCSIARCYYRMVAMTCLYPGVSNQSNRDQLIGQCKNALQQARFLDQDLIEAHYLLGQMCQYQGSFESDDAKRKSLYKDADDAYEKAHSLAAKQQLSARAIYTAQWAKFPLVNVTLDASERDREALKRAKDLIDLPQSPGGTLDPLNEEAVIRATVKNHQGDPAEAKSICDARFAASKRTRENADWAEVGLLLARADCEVALARKAKDVAMAKAAIDDAMRAAELAPLRDTAAFARERAASACYDAYSITQDPQYFKQAVNHLRAAIELAPRRPVAAGWCAEGAGWLVDKISKISSSPKPEQLYACESVELFSEALELLDNNLRWEDSPGVQTRRQNELFNTLRTGVSICALFANAAPGGKITPATPEEIQRLWGEINEWKTLRLPAIPNSASGRADLVTKLDELEKSLREKLGAAGLKPQPKPARPKPS